jgi:elongation factor Ts
MITAEKVKELRERTGVGMAKCKQALEEASGDINLAIDNLRKAGIANAVKKEGREAKEGLIAFAENGSHIAILEINSETDFVAKNDKFKDYLNAMAEEALSSTPASLEDFLGQTFSKGDGLSIDEYRSTIIQVLGENIVIRKLLILKKHKNHSYGLYSHMQGKLVTLVELSGPGQVTLAKDIAMHVAAEAPEYLNPEEVPHDVIEHEKEIARSQLAGKPDNIIEKILGGKVSAFFDQVCLTKQKFVKDSKHSVEEVASNAAKDLKVVRFARWQIGS